MAAILMLVSRYSGRKHHVSSAAEVAPTSICRQRELTKGNLRSLYALQSLGSVFDSASIAHHTYINNKPIKIKVPSAFFITFFHTSTLLIIPEQIALRDRRRLIIQSLSCRYTTDCLSLVFRLQLHSFYLSTSIALKSADIALVLIPSHLGIVRGQIEEFGC